ncbi:hypothetical protein GE061_015457 [Apolygus lucorum]|uniref:Uncharacterized protein n=1 Tax=Apolygus lucorum TaxID=248454 RepID=A0A6A4J8T9_APOLU|nr:hypothetical protein GE061_015457 [Apolygus lucorum]
MDISATGFEGETAVFDIVGTLPPELSQKILGYLSARDLARVAGVSRVWRSLTNCLPLWKRHCRNEQWPTLNMVENFKSHIPPRLIKAGCETLEPLCSWRINYEKNRGLPVAWAKNRTVRYRLTDPTDAPVTCISSDGVNLAMAKTNGTVTILNVERLPYFVTEFNALLPAPILQVRLLGDFCVVQQHMLLQLFSITTGFLDAKCFDMGFSLIELMERTKWKPKQVKSRYKPGKMKDLFFELAADRVFVAVRDFQCVYVWGKNGKREDTIHINNRMCKLRDMILHENHMYLIYAASRSIRHVTAYSVKERKWVFEVTTPLCKTQKLLVAQSLLIGVAVAGPGLTCTGVIIAWQREDGLVLSERHTQEYVCFRTVTTSYELVIYAETTAVSIWEPRSNSILRKVSTFGNPVYLRNLAFTFIAIFTDRYAYVWDWFTGARCFRIYAIYDPDGGEFMWTNENTLFMITEDDVVDMIGFN